MSKGARKRSRSQGVSPSRQRTLRLADCDPGAQVRITPFPLTSKVKPRFGSSFKWDDWPDVKYWGPGEPFEYTMTVD